MGRSQNCGHFEDLDNWPNHILVNLYWLWPSLMDIVVISK